MRLYHHFFVVLLVVISFPLSAQIMSSNNKGEAPLKDVKPSDGPIFAEGSVDEFTGAFGASYPLGTVKCASGLSYDAKLSYSGNRTSSTTNSALSGVPYGEGWSISVPMISMSAEAYKNFTQGQINAYRSRSGGSQPPCSPSYYDPINMDCDDIQTEGRLYWFTPMLSIPGVVSGKLIYKEERADKIIFTLNKFERYVEAELLYDDLNGTVSNTWKVRVDNGDVYNFNAQQYIQHNPSNQRMDLECSQPGPFNQSDCIGDNQNMGDVLKPQIETTAWYVTSYYNENLLGGSIFFSYDKFGCFNFLKEYNQVGSKNALGTGGVFPRGFSIGQVPDVPCVPRHLILREISGTVNRLEFEYRTKHDGANNRFPSHVEPNVFRYDSMYNYKSLYRWGDQIGEIPQGSPGFQDWKRYIHQASDNTNTTTPASTNPYIDAATNRYNYQRLNTQNAPFSHGFLESPRLFETAADEHLIPGDIYEFKGQFNSPGGHKSHLALFDLNVTSGENLEGFDNSGGTPHSSQYNKYHGLPVYSTFNRMVKWMNLKNRDGFYCSSNSFDLNNEFSALFTLPSYDYNQRQGINLQVGLSTADVDYATGPIEFCSITNAPLTCRTYPAFRQTVTCQSPWGIYYGDDAFPNFGVGVPFYNMMNIYGDAFPQLKFVDDPLTCGGQADHFWWNDINPPAGCNYPNVPTRSYNTELQHAELVRYSQNPYMLKRVVEYANNVPQDLCGRIECILNDYDCFVINETEFEYSTKVVNNTVLKQDGTHHNYGARKIYTLDVARSNTIDGSIAAYSPETYFYYDYQNDYIKFRQSGPTDFTTNNHYYLLSKIVDPNGKVTEIEYGQSLGGAVRIDQASGGITSVVDPPGPPGATSVKPIVSQLKYQDQNGTLLTDYTFTQPAANANNLPEMVAGTHFYSVPFGANDVGFGETEISGPYRTGQPNRPKTKKYFNTDFFFWSKPKAVEVFDEDGDLVSETEYVYNKLLAYENSIYKYPVDLSPFYYDEYRDGARPIPSSLSKADLATYDSALKTYRGGVKEFDGDIIFEGDWPLITRGSHSLMLWQYDQQLNYNPYLNKSFFIRMDSSITKNYDMLCGDTSSYTTQITEYQYWDADFRGISSSDAYRELFGNTNPTNELFYEPSWQVFSKKVTSEQMAGSHTVEESYYYYDLKNLYAYNGVPYADLYDPSIVGWEEIIDIDKYGFRTYKYQDRSRNKVPGDNEFISSKYYEYDKVPIFGTWGNQVYVSPCPTQTHPCGGGGGGLTLPHKPTSDIFFMEKEWVKSEDVVNDLVSFNHINGAPTFSNEVVLTYELEKMHDQGGVAKYKDVRGLTHRNKYATTYDEIYVTCAGGNELLPSFINHWGLPIGTVVGSGHPDSLETWIEYDLLNRISKQTDPNGTEFTYEYDSYGSLDKVYRNGTLIQDHDWGLYSTVQNRDNTPWAPDLPFHVRARRNIKKQYDYFSASDVRETKSFTDPLGRAAASSVNNVPQSNVLYDQYGRVKINLNPIDMLPNNTPKTFLVYPDTDEQETEYDTYPRQRPTRTSDYGLDVFGSHASKFDYCIATDTELTGLLTSAGITYSANEIHSSLYLVEEMEDQDGKINKLYKDPKGQTILTYNPGTGTTTFFVYGSQGQLIESINSKDQSSTFEYNQFGSLFKRNSPDEGERKFAYDRSGQQIGMMDAMAERRIYIYDDFGRMTSQRFLTSGSVLINMFDNKGMPWVTDPTFDVGSIVSGFKKEKDWFFDSHNTALNSSIHGGTRVLLLQHDNWNKGRMIQSISYDPNEKPVEYKFYGYDNRGFLSFENNQFNPNGISSGALGIYLTTEYEDYDRQGNAKEKNFDWGNDGLDFQIYREFDDWGRLTKVYGNYYDDGPNGHLFAEYSYDDKLNKVSQKRYYGSAFTDCTEESVCADMLINTFDYVYDSRHRLVSKVDDLFEYYMYYDNQIVPSHPDEIFLNMGSPVTNYNGNINGVSNYYKFTNVNVVPTIFSGDRTDYIYRYDELNRLVEANGYVHNATSCWTINPTQFSKVGDIGDASYTYDAIGNITQMNRTVLFSNGCIASNANHGYTYSSGNNRLTSFSQPTSYSCSGSPSNQTYQYTYDARGNVARNDLREVSSALFTRSAFPYYVFQPAKFRDIEYQYSSDDQRVYKDITNYWISPIQSEYYAMTGGGEVSAVYDYSDLSVTWYIYGNERVAKVKHAPTICPPDGGGGGGGEGGGGEEPGGGDNPLGLSGGGSIWTLPPNTVIHSHQTDINQLDTTNLYNQNLIEVAQNLDDSMGLDSLIFFDLPNTLYHVEIAGQGNKMYWEEDLPSSGVIDTVDIREITSLLEPMNAYDLDSNRIWINLNDLLGITFPDTFPSAGSNDGNGGGGDGNGGGGEEPEVKPPYGEYFIYDHLGNTRVVFEPTCEIGDEGGPSTIGHELVHVMDYHPYGKTIREYVAQDPEKFYTTFHERDVETGLDYRGARFYDSEVGRFLSVDPLSHKVLGWSPYNYVLGNTLILIDPTGLEAEGWSDDNKNLANRFGVFGNGGESFNNYSNLFSHSFDKIELGSEDFENEILQGLQSYQKHGAAYSNSNQRINGFYPSDVEDGPQKAVMTSDLIDFTQYKNNFKDGHTSGGWSTSPSKLSKFVSKELNRNGIRDINILRSDRQITDIMFKEHSKTFFTIELRGFEPWSPSMDKPVNVIRIRFYEEGAFKSWKNFINSSN